MADFEYESWREMDPDLLDAILDQQIDCCWSIPPVRQYQSLLRLRGDLPYTSSLSIQEVLDTMPRNLLERNTCRLPHFGSMADLLVSTGTVLEVENPLTYAFADVERVVTNFDRRFRPSEAIVLNYFEPTFEEDLEELLHFSPVAISFEIVDGYYYGTQHVYAPPPEIECSSEHVVLLTGKGINSDLVPFWEVQDSNGLLQGLNGYSRIRRYQNIVTEFMEITL